MGALASTDLHQEFYKSTIKRTRRNNLDLVYQVNKLNAVSTNLSSLHDLFAVTARLSCSADHDNNELSSRTSSFHAQPPEQASGKMFPILLMIAAQASADVTTEEIQFLNELPLDKLLRLKSSLQEMVTAGYENVTTATTTPSYLERFGAQAMAVKGLPIKRGDYEEIEHKKETKLGNIFSMSVTTLAFLAFGGYLLCLIVHAVKAKQQYQYPAPTVPPQQTFLLSAGIKKRPQAQFATYGRRKRENREARRLRQVELSPEELFLALVQMCEGYAKWSEGGSSTGL